MRTVLISAICLLPTMAMAEYKKPIQAETQTFLKSGYEIRVRHSDGFVRVCKAREWFFKGNKNPGYSIRCGEWFDPRQYSLPGTH